MRLLLFSLLLSLYCSAEPAYILLCWSSPDHPKGTHDYEGFATFYAETLEAEGYKTRVKEGFPTAEDWKEVDLVILNLTYNEMSTSEQKELTEYLEAGKDLMVLHQGLTQRKTYDNSNWERVTHP